MELNVTAGKKYKRNPIQLQLVFILTVLILSVTPAYATLPGPLSAIEPSIIQNDGVYFVDRAGNWYFTDADHSVNNLRTNNDTEIENDSLRGVVFDESAIINLYSEGDYRGDVGIEIRYNEATREILCTYEYKVRDAALHEEIKKVSCDSSPLDPLIRIEVENEPVYFLDLGKLCTRDDNNDGNCADKWDDKVSSFAISEIGKNVVVASIPPTTPTEPTSIFLGLAPAVYNFYIWSMSIGGLLALSIIIYGGVLYSASGGNPGRMGEAKKWIASALFGLALLFSSFLILNTINPDLTNLKDIELITNPDVDVAFGNIVGGGGGEAILGPPPVCREACQNVTDPSDWADVCYRLEPCPEWYCPLEVLSAGDGWLACRGSGGGAKCSWNTEPGDNCSSDHSGIDLHAPEGAPVFAIADGTLTKRLNDGDCGNSLTLVGSQKIDDDTFTYRYCHLMEGQPYASRVAEASEGINVSAGEHIGFNGETGNAKVPHVHFSVSSSGCGSGIYECTTGGCYGGKINATPIVNTACKMNIPVAPPYVPPSETCIERGGRCMTSNFCLGNDLTEIPGVVCPAQGTNPRVCCDLSGNNQ